MVQINVSKQWKIFSPILGSKGKLWILVSTFSGLSIAFVEFLISIQVANMLFFLGIQNQQVSLPWPLSLVKLTPYTFAICLILTGAIRSAAYFLSGHSPSVVAQIINTRLRLIAFYESFYSPRGLRSLSRLNVRVADHLENTTNFLSTLLVIATALIQLLASLAIMAYVAPKLTVIGILFVGIAGGIVQVFNRRIRKIAQAFPKYYQDIIFKMNTMSKNWFLLRSIRMLSHEHVKLSRLTLEYGTKAIRASLLGSFSSVLAPFLGLVVITALIFAQINYQTLSGPVFLAFLYLFLRLVQNLSTLFATLWRLNTFWPAYEIVCDYLNTFSPTEIQEAILPHFNLSSRGVERTLQEVLKTSVSVKPEMRQAQVAPPPTLKFQNVWYRYNDNGPWVIKDLSFEVRKGEQLALVGHSGSGKSTILALILGILSPTKGEISINQTSADDFLEKNADAIGYVSTEPFLIEGTVRENLIYGNRHLLTDDDLSQALKQAQMGEWFSKMGNTALDYLLSEHGEGLSTGQKQRLMLARAFTRKPGLLLLDEVSANLDEKTELEIADAILSFGNTCTTVIVSHRPGLISKVTNRVVLNPQ